jgi:hypothetical protein
LKKSGAEDTGPAAVKEGSVLESDRPSALAVVKNIRALAPQGKRPKMNEADSFHGFIGYYPKPGNQAPVNFGKNIFAEQGMQNLGRHIR